MTELRGSLGATRDQLRHLLGEPDDVGGTSCSKRVACIWKYGNIEYHFDDGGRVFLIYSEDCDGSPIVYGLQSAG